MKLKRTEINSKEHKRTDKWLKKATEDMDTEFSKKIETVKKTWDKMNLGMENWMSQTKDLMESLNKRLGYVDVGMPGISNEAQGLDHQW